MSIFKSISTTLINFKHSIVNSISNFKLSIQSINLKIEIGIDIVAGYWLMIIE